MNETEKAFEHNRLRRVLEQIQLQLSLRTDSYRESRADLQIELRNYWENHNTDFFEEAQLTESVERHRALTAVSYQRRSRFQKIAASPYFGRIDFAEDQPECGASEPIYIGIATLTDHDTGEFLTYDWRSPVAGMFYDFQRGPAFYQCPAGTITGAITLKRQYKIVDSRLEYMFDSDLKIDDEMLQEILGKSADDKMRTIVNSIQREQNRVIRDECHRLLLVRGPAGCGKTSIALHRAAYLLYQDRNAITAKNILIFSPNRIFSDYISGVLPELGEENVLQTTFWDYVTGSMQRFPLKIEDWNTQLEYLLTGSDDENYQTRVANIQYKSSHQYAGVIRNYLRFLEMFWIRDFPPIQFRGRTFLTQAEWKSLFFNNLAYLPVAGRLMQIRKLIRVRLRPLIHELRKEKEEVIAATGEEVNEKTMKALARLEVRQELNSFITEIEWLTELDPFKLYRRLIEDEALFHRLLEGEAVPKEWPAIRAQTIACFERGFIPYEDSFPLLYLQGILEGFPVRKEIRHLIIDEAQDYTTLQYEILKHLFPKCSWTILGDPDQSIRPYFQIPSFETTAQILNLENPLIIQLNRSYRSTREIQAFCQALLSEAGTVEHINRSGPLPEVIKLIRSDLVAETIASMIRKLKDEGRQSIAVICKTVRESIKVYEILKNKIKLSLITCEVTKFHSGINVIPVYLAKGLEFDAVLVYSANSQEYSKEPERNILYVACTRALHRLILYYSKELTPFVTAMDQDLYLTEEIC